uniref:GRANULINS domain-containing protein n=1 Tax=Steinernema glaseri TaxID=37863 RepID=A0A1I7Y851_9BILA
MKSFFCLVLLLGFVSASSAECSGTPCIHGCCPYPDAVCCPSGFACCPSGTVCNEAQQICFSVSFEKEDLSSWRAMLSELRKDDVQEAEDGILEGEWINWQAAFCKICTFWSF